MEALLISIGMGFVCVIGLIVMAVLIYTTILGRAGDEARRPHGGKVIGRLMALMPIIGFGEEKRNTESGPGYYE